MYPRLFTHSFIVICGFSQSCLGNLKENSITDEIVFLQWKYQPWQQDHTEAHIKEEGTLVLTSFVSLVVSENNES